MKANEKTCKENCNDDILLLAKIHHRLLSKVRGARHLATGLKAAKSLEQLFLARTGLGDEGGSHILLVRVVWVVDEAHRYYVHHPHDVHHHCDIQWVVGYLVYR